MGKMRFPTTLLEAVRYFADPDVAHEFATKIRWPHGIACPRMGCGSADIHYISTRRMWRCNECKRQFSSKVGTIFEDSPVGYDKWLPAMWLLASNRNGISSCELARGLGVTQKTAWFMLHRIRYAMKSGTFEKLAGPVEADETYIGGKTKGVPGAIPGRMKSRGPAVGKTIVMGIVERKGKVRAFVIPSVKRDTLQARIREHVEAGATIYTDALASYSGLHRDYTHHVINQAIEYVRGTVHTNSIEELLVCVQTHREGDVYRPASVAFGSLLRRANLPLQRARGNRRSAVPEGREDG